jgi:hypothetical protein
MAKGRKKAQTFIVLSQIINNKISGISLSNEQDPNQIMQSQAHNVDDIVCSKSEMLMLQIILQ